MTVGAYLANGECLVAGRKEVADRLGMTEAAVQEAMDGKRRVPGIIFSKLPDGSTHRIPTNFSYEKVRRKL